MNEDEGAFESNGPLARNARLDVLAYIRALLEDNDGSDAAFLIGQVLDGSAADTAQFLWQLSSLCATQFEMLAQASGAKSAVDFIAGIQQRELARQAGN